MSDDSVRVRVDRRELTPAARNLLAQLEATVECSADDPVCVYIDTLENVTTAVVSFSIETGELPGVAHLPVEEIEPVVLTYRSLEEIGLASPARLTFCREGFPNPKYHVNSWPPSNCYGIEPCLSGLRFPELFNTVGIQGVIRRAREWLIDAKTGNLLKDGWEPLPTHGTIFSFVDIDKIQESFAASKNKFCLTAANSTDHFVHFNPELQYPSDLPVREHSAWVKQLRERLGTKYICAIHINLVLDGCSEQQFIGKAVTLGDLMDELQEFSPGLLAQLRGWCADGELNAICRNKHEKQVILVVGIERPSAMMGSQHLASKDEHAARVEVAAFLVRAPTEQDCFYDDATVERVTILPVPNPDLFRHVSGDEAPEHVCVFGCGALGSQVALAFARKGTSKFTLFDPDYLLSHNIARHTGTCADFGSLKAVAVERAIRSLSIGPDYDIAARPVKFDPTNAEDLARVQTASLIIDCTADETSRRLLTLCRKVFASPVVRLEMYDEGHIGALGVQYPMDEGGLPDLYDLGLLYIAEAAKKTGHVRSWLKRERFGQASSTEMTVGIGCSSFTTILPGHVVSGHAATLIAASAKGLTEENALGYQRLDEAYLPNGAFHFVEGTSIFVAPVPDSEWHVHIARDVLERIHALRAECLGSETGGYLLGAYDFGLKRLTIVLASHAPNADKAGATHYELPPLRDDGDGKSMLRRTNNRLLSIGAWHSHPGKSAMPSMTDLATKAEHVLADCGKGIPSVMIIIAESQFSVAFGLEGEITVNVFDF